MFSSALRSGNDCSVGPPREQAPRGASDRQHTLDPQIQTWRKKTTLRLTQSRFELTFPVTRAQVRSSVLRAGNNCSVGPPREQAARGVPRHAPSIIPNPAKKRTKPGLSQHRFGPDFPRHPCTDEFVCSLRWQQLLRRASSRAAPQRRSRTASTHSIDHSNPSRNRRKWGSFFATFVISFGHCGVQLQLL